MFVKKGKEKYRKGINLIRNAKNRFALRKGNKKMVCYHKIVLEKVK
jgi:hypothetical protein